ncbi:hypothetical protein [Cereibacter sphaeroides]|uniref:hypothetical protein n=1 Tax=Cereibacter sphaeroides TaxID=1063 RepID=UPI003FCCABB0
MAAAPTRAGQIRRRLAEVFRATRQRARLAAETRIAERLGAADRLAAAAEALRDAVVSRLPKGLLDRILPHVDTANQAFEEAKAALPKRDRDRPARDDDGL